MSTTRPNVLLMLTDQERHDIADLTKPKVRTPSADRLSNEGIHFERAFTPIGVCSAARASLLTGLYPHNHGMLTNCHGPAAVIPNLSREHPTFGDILDESGYTNSYVGKWHVGVDQTPADFGFSYSPTVFDPGQSDSFTAAFRDYQREHGIDPDGIELTETIYTEFDPNVGDRYPHLIAGTTPVDPEATRPYFLATLTIKHLERYAGGGETPFFHRTDFPGPHAPYVVPEPYASMYDPDDINPWSTYDETFTGKPEIHQRHLFYRGVENFDWDRWAKAVAKMLGFVTFIDEQVDRVLDALDDLGLTEETAVVRGADHGDLAGGHRQFSKGAMMYDEVYRIPLRIRWPGVTEPGTRCGQFVRLLDLMPTFLEMGGETPPEGIDGRSLMSLLRGELPDDWPQSVFTEFHGHAFGLYSQRMVRTRDHKFIWNAPDVNELYDYGCDPNELHNLVDHPEYKPTRLELQERLRKWMVTTGDLPWVRKALSRDAA